MIATSAVADFYAAFNRVPTSARKRMTYNQGREIAQHAKITQETGVAIYFFAPHSPGQRSTNENINDLIRQYLPNGTDFSAHSQEELDAVAFKQNMRTRKRFDFQCPIKEMSELMAKHHESHQLSSESAALRVCIRHLAS